MKYPAPVKPLIKQLVAFTLLGSSLAVAGEASDPFGTEALVPPKPAMSLSKGHALQSNGMAGDPCAKTLSGDALNLADVVNLALCNNPQTREAWANARAQAAQVGVNRASYLPDSTLTASGERSWVDGASAVNQHSIGLSLSYLLYDFGARDANLENARQLLNAAVATQDSTVQAVFLSAVQAFTKHRRPMPRWMRRTNPNAPQRKALLPPRRAIQPEAQRPPTNCRRKPLTRKPRSTASPPTAT